MNFFRAQERAKTNTRMMVMLFVLAVSTLIVFTNALILSFLAYLEPETAMEYATYGHSVTLERLSHRFIHQLTLQRCLIISSAVLGLITLGSLFKVYSLRGGGRVVAEALGGKLVYANTRDYHQKRLLNVVEEMAIASGMPIPPVYVLPEKSINAFAAGFRPSDAVIGVTQGTIELLNRQELQGVIAHEFSHIFNGDMRLNLRLIGTLHGILLIALLGRFIFRAATKSSPSSSDKKSNPLPLLLLGLGLIFAGYAGLFFGRWIKAAVSRQREYLADASAIQYTRDSSGLSNALKKIGGLEQGSSIDHANAEEASHLFFSSAISSLFSTHPPLPERIKRVEPQWNGQYLLPVPIAKSEQQVKNESQPTLKERFGINTELLTSILAQSILTGIGEPEQKHLKYAAHLLENIPTVILEAVHDSYGARAVIYALLVSHKDTIRYDQLKKLKADADAAVFGLTQQLLPSIRGLDIQYRLPLVCLALPQLKALSSSQSQCFASNYEALIQADKTVNAFEWSLKTLLNHQFIDISPNVRQHKGIYSYFKPLLAEVSLLLSFISQAGDKTEPSARDAFLHSADYLMLSDLTYTSKAALSFNQVDEALTNLNRLAPQKKKELLLAFQQCISHDNYIHIEEAEVIRAIALVLECPIPPVLE